MAAKTVRDSEILHLLPIHSVSLGTIQRKVFCYCCPCCWLQIEKVPADINEVYFNSLNVILNQADIFIPCVRVVFLVFQVGSFPQSNLVCDLPTGTLACCIVLYQYIILLMALQTTKEHRDYLNYSFKLKVELINIFHFQYQTFHVHSCGRTCWRTFSIALSQTFHANTNI